jgi:two-component system chemotaxis response regulator CheB
MASPIRVLVVDDSALMRKLVSDMLAQDRDIEVIGQARDGADALVKIAALKPDVVTLDVEMPVMDGLETLSRIMKDHPIPVIMLSSLTQEGAATTMKCLHMGAVDFVGKPSGSISLDVQKVAADLIAKTKMAARVKPTIHTPVTVGPRVAWTPSVRHAQPNLVCIGSSTGGPRALNAVVPKLPVSLNVAVVIIQHLPETFTEMLASRLNSDSEFEVREAKEGDRLRAGVALVAPGGKHLEFDAAGVAHITTAPPIHGVRPSVDVTMGSLVRSHGSRMTAVLLTGMGRDGAIAMKGVRDAGGLTIAEDQSTCVVFGMPKAAYDLGAVERMLPLPEIAGAIIESIHPKAAGTPRDLQGSLKEKV